MPVNNDKNETTRFLGDGVSFKAKLIGILEVSEARGDRMCQEALSDLKMAIRAAGEHKQRITVNIAIDGLRLRDEKTGDSLYHHPVHKISFIAQDMSDSRAFGYIFGSPDTGHRFFGIKTDKAASQVVIAMRDLFQVVFALKKKEIELAKQHLDKSRYTSSPLFSDSSVSSAKLQAISQETSAKTSTNYETNKASCGASAEAKSGGTAVADLVDLELELNSLQQGLNQMERITPSDPFGSKDDPFGDSFISYTKPILPPPPSSGRERSSRTSETSSVFSPRTPHTLGGGSLDATSSADVSLISSRDVMKSKKDFSFSHDFNSSHEEPSSGDWFTPSAGNSIFEEPAPLVPAAEPTKDEKHEMTKQEILSQFDVFTELDPLELKNPPKKVLNDLVSQTQSQEPSLFNTITTTTRNLNKTKPPSTSSDFTSDPFGEDPFVTEDPFAETDFTKQDPFETEFADFKANKTPKLNDFDNFNKFDSKNLKSPKKSSMFDNKLSTSPRTVQFNNYNKQNTFDIHFEHTKKEEKLMQLHENPSLDMSSESECAPEPPPRPTSTLMQIKPPPLPPKKQSNDFAIKPPPRPPHTEDLSHYDYMDNYETAPSSLEFIKPTSSSNIGEEKSPPLPVPARKSKFDSDLAPERPKKHFNNEDNEYLTPISFPGGVGGSVLLPPPVKSSKKQNIAQVTVASYLESKPHLTTSIAADNLHCSLEGLDITLSQLTLSGLNELATKLHIPTNQLSNMTLVQLTNFLSNFIKAKDNPPSQLETNSNEFPAAAAGFKADFAANFNNLNNTASITVNQEQTSYDRYAVFRELMNEEIKQTKIDTEPEELKEELKEDEEKEEVDTNVNNINNVSNNEDGINEDKYAALREIVETELKLGVVEATDDNKNDPVIIPEENLLNEEETTTTPSIVDTSSIINIENKLLSEEVVKETNSKYNLIEYNTPLEKDHQKVAIALKSPVSTKQTNPIKSPVPIAITEIMQNNARLTSGSLSDVVSGSSPEVDNTGSNSDKKTAPDAAESWAIFDQGNVVGVESIKEKQAVQSEEGVSPWSSDSKEFGNGSPPSGWGRRGDSSSERWPKRKGRRGEEGWWDTSAEPEAQYYPSANRRSTDSYEEEYYECYERPRRRKQPGYVHGGQAAAAGGHSSSSRDVSPWEEEPRRVREQRPGWRSHQRQHSFEKHRDRRHTDSWDDEDDYEYEDEHPGGRFHRGERHIEPRDRHSSGSREHEADRWGDEWSEERKYRRRRGDDRWCCPDWDQTEHDKPLRYGSGRWSNPEGPPSGMWRDRKQHDERYYSRDSQESPWEDEYANEAEEIPPSSHYLSAKKNWKRPSSASEMDRKTGEIKSRHYLGTGGSDGERDRRYKPGRRSRSRDSQYSEPSHRHKPEPSGAGMMRSSHRNPKYSKPVQFENEFPDSSSKKQLDSKQSDHQSNKKSATLAANRKKSKESPKSEEKNIVISSSTFPRKGTARATATAASAKSLFENDFVQSEESPSSSSVNLRRVGAKFNFENDFETSEADSPTIVNKSLKSLRQQSMFEKTSTEFDSKDNYRQRSLKETRLAKQQNKPKSLFEDDFSPSDNNHEQILLEDNSISSIKEEIDPNNEEDDSFVSTNNFENNATNSARKKKFNKHRLSSNCDVNIKKSESVNIFARESDPFDDDFFSENAESVRGLERKNGNNGSPRTTDLKWTDDFDDFDAEEKK